MEIKARVEGNIIILYISDRIDVNSANLIEAVGQSIHDGYRDILLNLEEVEFIDYLGVSAITIAYKEVINNNGRMKFTSVPAHLRYIFSVSGLDRVIEIYPAEDLALNSFKEDKAIEHIKRLQLRRRFKRIPLDIKVELKDKYDKSPTCLKVDIINLSGIGGYIYGCDKYRLGDKLVIKFKLAPSNEEIELEAKVVWLSDRQVQPHIHPGMGVEFCNIPKNVQEKLIEFIERNLSRLTTE